MHSSPSHIKKAWYQNFNSLTFELRPLSPLIIFSMHQYVHWQYCIQVLCVVVLMFNLQKNTSCKKVGKQVMHKKFERAHRNVGGNGENVGIGHRTWPPTQTFGGVASYVLCRRFHCPPLHSYVPFLFYASLVYKIFQSRYR